MKKELLAIPVFQDRISPLLDEARRFILVELTDGSVLQRSVVTLNAGSAMLRMAKLKEIGVSVIISGAVSGYLSAFINEQGFIHYSWASGQVDEVVSLYLDGRLKPAGDCGKPCRGSGRSCKQGFACGKKDINEEERNI